VDRAGSDVGIFVLEVVAETAKADHAVRLGRRDCACVAEGAKVGGSVLRVVRLAQPILLECLADELGNRVDQELEAVLDGVDLRELGRIGRTRRGLVGVQREVVAEYIRGVAEAS
jgi:hypothetical protein